MRMKSPIPIRKIEIFESDHKKAKFKDDEISDDESVIHSMKLSVPKWRKYLVSDDNYIIETQSTQSKESTPISPLRVTINLDITKPS